MDNPASYELGEAPRGPDAFIADLRVIAAFAIVAAALSWTYILIALVFFG